jgi:hypothetical protein
VQSATECTGWAFTNRSLQAAEKQQCWQFSFDKIAGSAMLEARIPQRDNACRKLSCVSVLASGFISGPSRPFKALEPPAIIARPHVKPQTQAKSIASEPPWLPEGKEL